MSDWNDCKKTRKSLFDVWDLDDPGDDERSPLRHRLETGMLGQLQSTHPDSTCSNHAFEKHFQQSQTRAKSTRYNPQRSLAVTAVQMTQPIAH